MLASNQKKKYDTGKQNKGGSRTVEDLNAIFQTGLNMKREARRPAKYEQKKNTPSAEAEEAGTCGGRNSTVFTKVLGLLRGI